MDETNGIELKPQIVENKMGIMPVKKLLFTMALPMILSMLVQAMYNIVDSIFVAQINEDALTAVSLAFPIQNIIISIAVGTSIGVNALLSKSLGEKNFDRANKVASNSFFLAIINTLVLVLFGFFGAKAYFNMQKISQEIITYGTEYTAIISIFSIGVFLEITCEKLLQGTGKTLLSMCIQLSGAIINIVLDPIMIFGLCGLPEMGVRGAAYATVIGQIIAAIVGVLLNIFCNKEIKLRIKDMVPKWDIIKKIYKVGLPSMIMQSIGSLMIFLFNQILLAFNTAATAIGSTATAFLGIYFKLQSVVFMPVFGINSAVIPIVAYNYGYRSKPRINQTIKTAVITATGILLVGFILLQAIPRQLLMLFNPSEDMLEMGVPALRAISYTFLMAGFNIVMSGSFQALGNGLFSLIVSLLRQIIVAVPVGWLLTRSGNINNFWWCISISEFSGLIASIVFLLITKKRVDRELNDIEPDKSDIDLDKIIEDKNSNNIDK